MAIFLSRMLIDSRNQQAADVLTDRHRLHRFVLTGFPSVGEGETAGHTFGVLYRLETMDLPRGGVMLLVQSNVQPRWAHLDTTFLLRTPQGDNPSTREVTDIYAQIGEGATLFFRLTASPTASTVEARGVRGKRRPITEREQQRQWLQRQAERGGFALVMESVRVVDFERLVGWRRSQAIVHHAATFEGHLRVTDSTAFQQTLVSGVGRGRAYGLGLLSIAADRPHEG